MALMKTILEWQGPYSMKDLLTSPTKKSEWSCSGVYLWEEPGPDGHRVAYVGKANNLWHRQLEHYWYQLGSAYLLPGRYRECGEAWCLDLSDAHVRDTLFDLGKFTKLVQENFAYINGVRLHFALTDDTQVIEANLIYQIKPVGNTKGKATAPATAIEFEHHNKNWTLDGRA